MKSLSFKEYYESKKKLLEAVDSNPRLKITYRVNKYCKIPLFESSDPDTKIYESLKPNDEITVVWEYNDKTPAIRYMQLSEHTRTCFPVWNNLKMFNWITHNTQEL